MTNLKVLLSVLIIVMITSFIQKPKIQQLFNGQSFKGWEGDTIKTWRIVNNAIVGGSLSETVPNNDFICTKKSYSDFRLRLKFKIESAAGFMNAGVQFRSQRLKDPAYEMTGYQADIGPNYFGALYDESRRNKTLAKPDSLILKKALKIDQWNDYEIKAVKNHIELKLNGVKTVDYFEMEPNIPQFGIIGLQIHGGGKTMVSYKNILIEEL